MKIHGSLLATLLLAGTARLGAQDPQEFFTRPHFLMGGGSLQYRETDFKLAPTLHSHFEESVFQTGIGWEFVIAGHHGLDLGFEFQGTTNGTEQWHENGALVQENNLTIDRFNLEFGYEVSTWNRADPPETLSGASRVIRFAGGIGTYYRHQHFDRSDFLDLSQIPAVFSNATVVETFDMVGGEIRMDLEIGPRHLACFYARGRAGGGYVGVLNDGLEPLIHKEDARIDTVSVQGSIEAGVLSQFAPNVELRLGYRYLRQAVTNERRTNNAVDPILGPVIVSIELPDNTTEMHLVFIEAAFPF